ncbi:MAG: hypothetical protein ACKV2V_07155 [Blastocatellia bacterium]
MGNIHCLSPPFFLFAMFRAGQCAGLLFLGQFGDARLHRGSRPENHDTLFEIELQFRNRELCNVRHEWENSWHDLKNAIEGNSCDGAQSM